jgi:fatty acid/phospholipid biosynthesis enzyme
MKSIVVDLYPDLIYKTSLLLAFKIYLYHNSNYHLLVVGRANDLPVLSGIEGLTTLEAPEGQSTADAAIKEVLKGGTAGLISFTPKPAFYQTAKTLFPKAINPCFALSYHSKKNDRQTLIIEVSGLFEKSKENLEAAFSYGRDYLVNILNRLDPTIGLLGMEEALDPTLKAFDEEMRQEKKYRGLVAPEDMFDGECDLLLSGGIDGALAIRAAKGSRSISKELAESEANRGNSSKFTSLFAFGGKKKGTVDKQTDPRVDSTGYLLFGFGYNLLCLNQDSGYNDFFSGVEKIEQIDRIKAFHS